MSRFLAALLALTIATLARHANAQSWLQQSGPGPSLRYIVPMAYDSTRGVVVLFGGYDGTAAWGDTWEWNSAAGWVQRTVAGPSPSARYGSAMAYDSARHVAVLFGGADSSGVAMGDLWEWDGAAGTWTQRVAGGPTARNEASMAYDSARGVTVLFGGHGSGPFPTDTWEWNGTNWTQHIVPGPSGRYFTAMAYDAGLGETVLFGGFLANSTWNAETWRWNGAAAGGQGTWTQRIVSSPPGRAAHSMAYDSARHVIVLFGGQTAGGVAQSETWEWDGASQGGVWGLRAIPGPPARFGQGMAFDTALGVTVLFGGRHDLTSTGILGDTWVLGGQNAAPVITQPPVGVMVREGAPASFTVGASFVSTYQWKRNGVPLSNGGAVSGATSATLTINPTAITDSTAVFDCDLTGLFGGSSHTSTVGLAVIPRCGSADFNGDGDLGTDADIEAFFRVLAGGSCQ